MFRTYMNSALAISCKCSKPRSIFSERPVWFARYQFVYKDQVDPLNGCQLTAFHCFLSVFSERFPLVVKIHRSTQSHLSCNMRLTKVRSFGDTETFNEVIHIDGVHDHY
jgi:hypothetical protein